jgi:acetylornithine deacetylase/succinyl-diaminopimelate desuccinylase-like protein
MPDAALTYAREHRWQYLEALFDLLRIPSISTLPAHRPDIERAAAWLADHLCGLGLASVEIIPTEGHPVVYGEWLGAEGAPTLLAYGHYDVQPADPLEEWRTPPFEPTLRGDDLFCRGASDDKGQFFAVLAAVEAYLKTAGRLPINLKVVLEGEEEILGESLPTVLRQRHEALAADAVLICDEACLDPQTPLIMYGVRGNCYLEVEVRGPARDLHSGTFGGAVDNPFNVLVRLLAACQDPATHRVLVPGFYDRVRPLEDEERAILAQIPVTDAVARALTGAPALGGEDGYTTLERVSVRPTFDIHGLPGGFTGEGKKTVIPARAAAKVSMRMVPDQDPHEIARLFKSYLRSIAPPTVELSFHLWGAAQPALIDYRAPEIQAMADAFERGFGTRPLYMRGGGSLPIVHDFQEVLAAPIVLTGFGLPDDNAHAPNPAHSPGPAAACPRSPRPCPTPGSRPAQPGSPIPLLQQPSRPGLGRGTYASQPGSGPPRGLGDCRPLAGRRAGCRPGERIPRLPPVLP